MTDEQVPASTARPDAILIPPEWSPHGNALERLHATCEHAAKILGTTRDKIRIRIGEPGPRFTTASSRDTLFFPIDHERAGQPRYRWERQQDGFVYGYYVDEEARSVYHVKP